MSEYTVVIEKSENNYGVWVPDHDGCVATGKTIEEVIVNIREAIEMHIDSSIEHGEEVRESTGLFGLPSSRWQLSRSP